MTADDPLRHFDSIAAFFEVLTDPGKYKQAKAELTEYARTGVEARRDAEEFHKTADKRLQEARRLESELGSRRLKVDADTEKVSKWEDELGARELRAKEFERNLADRETKLNQHANELARTEKKLADETDRIARLKEEVKARLG